MIKFRPSTRKEQVTLDVLRGLFGIMLLFTVEVFDINAGRVPYNNVIMTTGDIIAIFINKL